nr:hypothetical protein [Tanacetum cinerariifolium]
MNTKEISDRYVAPSFVNGLEAYDGEINLGTEENMISNEFAVEPGVVLGRAFMHLTKGITDFGKGTITIYPELDPFLDRKNSMNKRKQLEKYQLIYSDLGPSLSTRKSLTQEEGEKEALAIDIYRRYSLLDEERPVIETMAYSDMYKKILHEIFIDKMKLDEAKINLNALANTGSDINVMPYRVYKELGREEVQNVKREITILNHSTAEPMGLLKDVMCQKKVVSFLGSLPIPLQHVDWKPDYTGCFNRKEDSDGKWHAEIRLTNPYRNMYDQVCADDELKTKKIIKFRLCGRAFSWTLLEFAKSDEHFNALEYWLSISREENLGLSRSHASTIWKLVLRVLHKMITYGLCQRTTGALDTTTLRELIDSEGRLILEVPKPGVPRVAIPRPQKHRYMICLRG